MKEPGAFLKCRTHPSYLSKKLQLFNRLASTSRLRMQASFFPFSKSEIKLRSITTCSVKNTAYPLDSTRLDKLESAEIQSWRRR